MQLAISNNIYQQAQIYADQQGQSITRMVENYLLQFISRNQAQEQATPDVVLSLLGAGEGVAQEDLNGRQAYYQFLEEKYK